MRIYVDRDDRWIGVYKGPNHWYICPIPCVVIRLKRKDSEVAVTTEDELDRIRQGYADAIEPARAALAGFLGTDGDLTTWVAELIERCQAADAEALRWTEIAGNQAEELERLHADLANLPHGEALANLRGFAAGGVAATHQLVEFLGVEQPLGEAVAATIARCANAERELAQARGEDSV